MNRKFIEDLIKKLNPDRMISGDSTKWANWMSVLMQNSCQNCVEQHGKIVDISILKNKTEVQAHRNCQCVYVPMRTKLVGTVTDMGMEGTDVYLIYFGILPGYYISKKQAQKAGWQSWTGNLDEVLPNKMIGGDIYKNKEGKLPSAPGREWYEADINFAEGYRNRERILYSNDGLIFATFDHCQTFYEITE